MQRQTSRSRTRRFRVVGILLAFLWFAAPPAFAQERVETQLNAVAFTGPPCTDKARGAIIRGELRLEPNSSKSPSVATSEIASGGAGSMWRASLWMAAFHATQNTGHDIADYEFFLKADGLVDGPSAGMLLTAKYIALLNGDDIRSDTTMTGTINPDGSAGPVGGIPQKIEAASQAGLTRFGYPVGTRWSQDLRTCKQVNLDEWGEKRGVETREIKDIRDAYHFLTGKKLPTYEKAAASDMALTPEEEDAYRANAARVNKEIEVTAKEFSKKLESLDPEARKFIDVRWLESESQYASQLQKMAVTYMKGGQWAAAQWRLEDTLRVLWVLPEYIDLAGHLSRQELDAIKRRFGELDKMANARIGQFAEPLFTGLRERKTIGSRIEFLDYITFLATADYLLYRARLQSNYIVQLSEKVIAGEMDLTRKKDFQAFHSAVFETLRGYGNAIALEKIMEGQILVGEANERGPSPQTDPETVRNMAQAFAAASKAELSYFDAVILKEAATSSGMSLASVQNSFAHRELSYGVSRHFSNTTMGSITGEEAPEVRGLRDLALGVDSYVMVGSLINKYYSLRQDPQTQKVTNLSALTHQLELARARALEAAGRCKKQLGFVPSASRRHFQNAVAFREGSDQEKLTALSEFWYSTFWSELAVRFAGGTPETTQIADTSVTDDASETDTTIGVHEDVPEPEQKKGPKQAFVFVPELTVPAVGSAVATFGCEDGTGLGLCEDVWTDRGASDLSSVRVGADVMYAIGALRFGGGLAYGPRVAARFEAKEGPDINGVVIEYPEQEYDFGSELVAVGILEVAPEFGWLFVPMRLQAGLAALFEGGDLASDLDSYCASMPDVVADCSVTRGPFIGVDFGASIGAGVVFGAVAVRLDTTLGFSSVQYWSETVSFTETAGEVSQTQTLGRVSAGLKLGLEFRL